MADLAALALHCASLAGPSPPGVLAAGDSGPLFLGGGADAAPPFTMVGRVNAIPPCSLMDGVDMGLPWLFVFGAIALLPGVVLTA